MRGLAVLVLVGCGSKALPSAVASEAGPDADEPIIITDQDTAPLCRNLECQIPTCGTQEGTTITGIVRDPSNTLPLYNIYVFIPNEPIEPIPQGVRCGQCEPPVTGHPINASVSNTDGVYRMSNTPAGTFPIVVQSSYYRRRIVASIKPCEANVIDLRLPRNEQEGDLPLIAVTSGVDRLECFLHDRVGLDTSEITGPKGGGRVHVYRGNDAAQGLPSAGDAAALIGDLNAMKKYNVIMLASESTPTAHDTNGDGYANIKAYMEAGGRVYATHNEFNFFASQSQCVAGDHCGGAYGTAAEWKQAKGASPPNKVSITFPKGKAISDWYRSVTKLPLFQGYAASSPEVPLVDTFADVGRAKYPTLAWVYRGDTTGDFDTSILSFLSPQGLSPDKQCGRLYFIDANATGSRANGPLWPQSCDVGPIDHTPNELLLEFLLFDLPSCVQDDLPPLAP